MFHIAHKFQGDDTKSNQWEIGKFHPSFQNSEEAQEYIDRISYPENTFEYKVMFLLPTRS